MAIKGTKIVNNAGLLELYRVVLNLYNRGLVTKDEIKELTNSLKDLTDQLPEVQERFLH